jgi:hypothetical protein
MPEPESELLCDWRFTANHFILASSALRLTTSNFIFQLNTCGYSPYVTFRLTRGLFCRLLLLLVLASAVTLRSESRGTQRPYFTVTDSRLPQHGGPGLRFYIPQEQGGPVIPPRTGFPFLRLLLLAGLRWRYPTPPPPGCHSNAIIVLSQYISTFRTLYCSPELTVAHITSQGRSGQCCLHFLRQSQGSEASEVWSNISVRKNL